jgi:hypothetical protein
VLCCLVPGSGSGLSLGCFQAPTSSSFPSLLSLDNTDLASMGTKLYVGNLSWRWALLASLL